MNPKKKNNIADTLAKAGWALPIIIWAVLACLAGSFLHMVQERSIFEYDLFWITGYLVKPSGALSVCSLFLTQFLHWPYAGALIWVALLTAAARLTARVFGIPSNLSLLAYIPSAIMFTYNMSLGYIIYAVQLPGFFFMPVLGYLFALLTITVLRKPLKPAVTAAVVLIWGLAGYYAAGFYALAGIAASAVDAAFSEKSRQHRIWHIAGALTVIVIVPITLLDTTTYSLSSAWTIGLPQEMFEVPASRLQAPLAAAMLIPVLAPVIRRFVKIGTAYIALTIQCVSLAALMAVPATLRFSDDNFKAELSMILAADDLDWDKVITVYENISSRKEKEASWQPTRIMVMLKDLALIKTGQEADKGFAYDDGSAQQKTRWTIPSSFQTGTLMHFHYGLPGTCHRWCYEESVLSGWTCRTLKYAAMNAIAGGHAALAERYLSHLENTVFYCKWARQQRSLCHDMDKVAVTAPYDQVLALMCYDDEICSDDAGCEYFIMEHFNGPSPAQSTPQYDRVALYFALKSKQPSLFLTRFLIYMESNNPQTIGRHYQEAAYLSGILTHNDLLKSMPFDERVTKNYDTFAKNLNRYGKMSIEQSRTVLPANQRHSYYYYYYYVNELQMF